VRTIEQALGVRIAVTGTSIRISGGDAEQALAGKLLGELYELVRALNRYADAQKLEPGSDPLLFEPFRSGVVILKELTQILGLFVRPRLKAGPSQDKLTGPLLDLFVELRTRVRKEKNFALADDIRKKLAELGVTLEDRPDGTSWKID